MRECNHGKSTKDLKVNPYMAGFSTRRGLIDTFQGIVHDMGELDGLIWSFHRQIAADKFRPLSKLTADILHILRKD